MKKILDRLEKYSREKVDEEKESIENLTEAELSEREERIANKKAEMREKFESFWKQFGRSLKLGIVEDIANRQKIAEIVKFRSTFNDTNTLISFDDYLSRAKPEQKDIYYITFSTIACSLLAPMFSVC